jgi:isopentenyl diphosphate isomerase/L-lactate dehydrogenase-like FMN-dependent dehydrogenase
MISQLKSLVPKGFPIILRGVTNSADVLKAIEYGASAIWVTNQGNIKHFDSVETSMAMLESVAKVVSNSTNCEIFYSGGIRRGTDVVKALAYGAKAVFLDPETINWAFAFE